MIVLKDVRIPFLKEQEYSENSELPTAGTPEPHWTARQISGRTGWCLRLKVVFIIVFVFVFLRDLERKLCSCVPIVLFMCSNEVYPESWAPAGQPRVLKAGCDAAVF